MQASTPLFGILKGVKPTETKLASQTRVPSVTLADVAERVGVSARTVSRVVNDEGGFTEATRARVLDAIDELGYRPNLMARGLTRRRSDTIGLVTAEMRDPFFPEFADGVERAALTVGRTMFLASSNADPDRQRRALISLIGHGVDGAIVFPAAGSRDDLVRIAKELPIVVVNDELDAPGIASVTAEIEQGAVLATDHLLQRGRRRVALLIETEAHRRGLSASRRARGYRLAHQRNSVPIDERLVIGVENSVDGGRTGAEHALGLAEPPDAIFAYNDVIAIGALQRCLALGYAVPDDIAIVGFDDIMMCEATSPPLTSVRIDRDQLGRSAVEMLLHLVESGPAPPQRLPVELIVRQSS